MLVHEMLHSRMYHLLSMDHSVVRDKNPHTGYKAQYIFDSFVLFVMGCYLKSDKLKVGVTFLPIKLFTTKFQAIWTTKNSYGKERNTANNTQSHSQGI